MELRIRNAAPIACALVLATILGCDTAPTAPPVSTLAVYVHWNGTGLPDRRLDIVELGVTQTTDAGGRATFTLRPGHWTLRAYVNHGGPVGAIDLAVTTRAGETSQVDVVDCVPCLAAS
ncbi:MAG: hypothetical protein HYR74_05460 [Candidatus Eisenbacteria bacterium]|nr:hypothetical protein [Candidatus Eisenbacteria bacterium]